MTALWMWLGLICVLHAEYASGSVCTQVKTRQVVTTYLRTTRCGWWGWSRCYSKNTRYKIVTDRDESCCPGSYGSVADGCPGVCPYISAQRSSACPGSRICRDYQCDNSMVDTSSLPTQKVLTFNENDDTERLLWTVNATCFVQYSCQCGGAPCQCSKTVPCTHCTVTSMNRIAEVRNGVSIYRKECQEPGCNDCRSYPGCLDHGVSYRVAVECRASGYTDNGVVRRTLALIVEEAPKAVIELPPGADDPVELDTDAKIGDVVLTIANITIPPSEKPLSYSLKGPVSNITGRSLFIYDSVSRQIRVNSSLSQEPGGVYTLQICVELRRGEDCADFVVEIERITTTSTTTTTTPKPTTAPEEEYICIAAGFWKQLPFMDLWCNLVCGPDPENCPYLQTHCSCASVSDERIGCIAGGIYAASEHSRKAMNVWCDLNCNSGEYSNCPTNTSLPGYCVCN